MEQGQRVASIEIYSDREYSGDDCASRIVAGDPLCSGKRPSYPRREARRSDVEARQGVMDQESTKPGPIGGTKGSWRDRLGINKELPKISEEFKQTPPKAASSDHPESADDRAPPLRPGTPVSKPAPMAPRQPAGDLGDRIRQQREAAERMAEKRVAEAKERAVQQPRPGMPPAPGGGAPPPGQRPKFTFADEEFRQAQQEPREPQQPPPPRQWTQAPHPANSTRPVFT